MGLFSIPTQHTGFLPGVLGSLDERLRAENASEYKQQALATLTATVWAAVMAVVDAAIHAVVFVVKAPFTLLKVTVGNLFNIGQYPALEAKEWFAHAQRVYKCFVMLVNAAIIGAFVPAGVLAMGRVLKMMPSDAPKPVVVEAAASVAEPAKT